jgi:hypothetical protein
MKFVKVRDDLTLSINHYGDFMLDGKDILFYPLHGGAPVEVVYKREEYARKAWERLHEFLVNEEKMLDISNRRWTGQ